MKIEGVRPEPISALRRRGGTGVVSDQAPRPADSVSILGLSEAEMTEPVRGALEALSREIDALRQEIVQLQARLTEAEDLADTDVLTPVLNRRAFVRELQRAISTARRHGAPASVVYFDLDGFKAINDRFGHAAGDAALMATAERLWSNIRAEDVAARLGGDEFAVLLMHADRLAARLKAEALKAVIEGEPVRHGGVEFALAVTYGVRQLGGTDDAEQALGEADAAMYIRKPPR